MDSARRRPLCEFLAVLLTGAAFLAFENLLGLKIPFLAAATVLWTVYLVRRMRREPGAAREWGLRLDTLKPATGLSAAVFAVLLAAVAVYRAAAGWRPLPAEAAAVFAAYPAWAFLQQFVLQALVASNLDRLGLRPPAVVGLSAALFGLAHLPDVPLAALCAAAGLAWTPVFLRTRNLVPLALSHAWLGTLAYYWILERDPWLEMIPR